MPVRCQQDLQPTQKKAHDLRCVAKANITPEEEFKTEMHSIKREAEQKFIGTLTKVHYRRIECNNDKLRRVKSDKSWSKRDTDWA